MATLQISLPDDLAQDLADSGLLEPDVIEATLRARLRTARVADLRAIWSALEADPLEPMSNDEINAEIAAYRAEQRHASGP